MAAPIAPRERRESMRRLAAADHGQRSQQSSEDVSLGLLLRQQHFHFFRRVRNHELVVVVAVPLRPSPPSVSPSNRNTTPR